MNKSNEEKINDVYRDWAANYDDYAQNHNIAVKKVHPVIVRLMEEEPRGGIGLDLGCGTGLVTHLASKFSSEMIGIDRSLAMLKEARKKKSLGAKLDFRQDDISKKLDYPDNHFDFVISALALNHIEQFEPVYQEVYRVLKPGGFFIFDEPDSSPRSPDRLEHKPRPKILDPLIQNKDKGVTTWHSRPFESIEKGLKDAGFEIVEIVKTYYDDEIKDMIENFEYHKGFVFSRIVKARKPN